MTEYYCPSEDELKQTLEEYYFDCWLDSIDYYELTRGR